MSENKPVIAAAVTAGLLIVGFIIYTLVQHEDETVVVFEPITISEPEPEPESVSLEPEPEPESELQFELEVEPESESEVIKPEPPAFVLPRLDDSDQLIRDGSVSLTRHEGINFWLSPDELIRKFVVFVDNVANGRVARGPARVLTPEGPFTVKKMSEKVFLLDTSSYYRYNMFTEVITSIDARRAAEFYELLRPLYQEAFDELGYPEQSFDDVMFRAVGRLLETPVIEDPILLTQPVVMYEFADSRLEALSAVQKQMIRMGPQNTRALKAKISEVALELRAILEN